ncbi:MAG TPA: hypothetical protein VNT52_03580 [Acidimicrobiales bacterium]|nr:hypothetical protein [Acidimicrobiales bacterium]
MARLKQALLAPRMEALFAAAVVLFGFRLGARPIGDNSMLTHLRTGIDMARTGAIPRTDPYSFTAAGEHWVVQSWLSEWTYGWAYRIGGFKLVVLQQGVLIALLAWLVVRLARAGSPLRTTLAALAAVGVGTSLWTPRPLLFGLICMALTVTVVERRRSPWLLIPIVWLWVNTHGSFPLGLVWLGARALGEGIDWRAWPRETWRYIGGFGAGLLAAVLNPLGPRLLLFPLTLGEKRDAFKYIIEWRSPDFSRGGGYFALAFLALALVLLMRARLSWRDVVPVVAFLVGSLLAARNIGPLAVVLAPVLGRAVRRPESAPGRPDRVTGSQLRLNRAAMATILAAFVVFGSLVAVSDPLDLVGYPVEAVTYLEEQGLLSAPHRVVEQDFVGNYITFRYGSRVQIFIDDRFDMYPLSVTRDYRTLVTAGAATFDVLARHDIDVVLWQRKEPLVPLLMASGWRETFAEGDYVVLQR